MNKLTSFVNKKILMGFIAVVALFAIVGVETASAAYTHTVTLRLGTTGSQVMSLQQTLNSAGFMVATGVNAGAPGYETSYFGPRTLGAVRSFQAAKGLVADGIVGPMTGARLQMVTGGSANVPLCPNGNTQASNCTVRPGGTVVLCPNGNTLASNCTVSPSGGSTGGTNGNIGNDDGDITDLNEVSTDDSSIEEGGTNEVFGFEFDVEGDISVDRVDFYMEISDSTTASEDPEDYFTSAFLMVDGQKVATLDVDDWDQDDYNIVTNGTTDDDEYRLRFSGLDEVFNDGDTPEFTLAFEANNTIDSADLAGDWVVGLTTDSIRFVDGRGFSSEEGASFSSMSETFGADSEEVAELRVRASAEDLVATNIEVSDQDTTDNVPVFIFEIEERNGIDVTVNDLTVTITTGATSGTTTESTVVQDATLFMGSTELASESVPSNGVVNFENMDLDIDASDTVELTLKLTFADADNFASGTDLSVTINGSTDIDDAEDANGNDEGDMTLGGSATSETHRLATEGILVTFDESSFLKTSSDTAGINETVQFTLEFDVTAFGDDMYIDKDCSVNSAPASTYVTTAAVSLDNDTDGSSTTCTDFDSTGNEGSSSFEVLEGQTEHFTVTILGNGGEAGGAGNSYTFTARLESLGYNVGSDGAGDTQYAFDLADFHSSAVTVFDR